MIGKVVRGSDAGGLLRYLYGPGRANEHTDPHLVAGFGDPAELEPECAPTGLRDLRRLSGLLAQPLAALDRPGYGKPVWHCSVRAAPGDRLLSDGEWAQVAAEIMDRTGLAPKDDDLGVRWVTVRHAADHVHIVATLARQDGTKPSVWNDFYRLREACQAAERRLGLQATASADRTAARRPTRAEAEQAARRGWQEPPRVTLRRRVCAAAVGASTEREFFARLRDSGVLVRQRLGTKDRGAVTGYAVGLERHRNKDGGVVWFGGGKLAADLTLPKLRQRWSPRSAATPRAQPGRITAAERNAVYEHAARTARAATEHIRYCSFADPMQAADAAWAAADVLRVAARTLRNPELRRAADAYDRAARAPHGRIPGCTRSGEQLRLVARRLAVMSPEHGLGGRAEQLVVSLAVLTAAVADLRAAQHHAAQAAARLAAEHLGSGTGEQQFDPKRAETRDRGTSRRVADAVRKDFPAGLTLRRPTAAAAAARPDPRRPASPRSGPRRQRPPPR